MNKCKDLSTEQKRDILEMVDRGYTNEQIGDQFNVTPQSVAAYKAWRTRR
jgi:DNA-binding NarL/FixJ family response regulator